MNDDNLSIQALLARRAIAARLEFVSWAFEAHGDTGDYGVGILLDDNGVVVSGEQPTGERFIDEVIAVEVKGVAYASHISSNSPDVVCATIDELLRLREENAQLEREAESLRAVLQHAENWSTRIHTACMDPTRPRQAIGEMAAALEKFIKEAEAAREGVEES